VRGDAVAFSFGPSLPDGPRRMLRSVPRVSWSLVTSVRWPHERVSLGLLGRNRVVSGTAPQVRENRSTSAIPPRHPLTARSAIWTVFAQFGAKVPLLLAALVSTSIVTRALGTDRYAQWATVLSILAMVSFLTDPGLSAVLVKRISGGDADLPPISTLILLKMGLAMLVFLIVVAGTSVLQGLAAIPIAVALGAQVFPRSAIQLSSGWMQARHRLHWQTWLDALLSALGVLIMFAASRAGAVGWQLALFGVTLPTVALAVLSHRQARNLIVGAPTNAHWQKILPILREAAPLAAALALVALYSRIDVVFVTAAERPAGVAAYLLAYRVVDQTMVVATVLGTSVLPLVAARAQRTAIASNPATHSMLVCIALIGAIGSLLAVALATPAIYVLGGSRFRTAVPLLTLLAPEIAALFLNFGLGYTLIGMGRSRRYLSINAVALLLNILANLLFTLQFGARAAAIVTWCTELSVVCLAAAPFFQATAKGRGAILRALSLCATAAVVGVVVGFVPQLRTVAVIGGLLLLALLGSPDAVSLVRRARG
jgi:O-antigen/teichoic acid export membrane protein